LKARPGSTGTGFLLKLFQAGHPQGALVEIRLLAIARKQPMGQVGKIMPGDPAGRLLGAVVSLRGICACRRIKKLI